MSDYGSDVDVDEATLRGLLPQSESDYGSDFDEETPVTPSSGHPKAPASDYGSDIGSPKAPASDYGSDIDDTTATSLLVKATPTPTRRSGTSGLSKNFRFDSPTAPPQHRPHFRRQNRPIRLERLVRKDLKVHDLDRHEAVQSQSPLMDLPPELRNRIYEFVFDGHVARLHTNKPYKPPGVLFASRQLHREAIGVFYTTAIFSARYAPILKRRLVAVKNYGLANVTHVRIDTVETQSGVRLYQFALAYWAEQTLKTIRKFWGGRWAVRDSSKILEVSLRTPFHEKIWSETPLETYRVLDLGFGIGAKNLEPAAFARLAESFYMYELYDIY